MSGIIVSAVFASALAPHLKPCAALCASFAASDGSQVYPSIATMARALGKSERTVQRAIHDLRALGVLVVELGPGFKRATHYRFSTAALPQTGDPDQMDLFPQGKRRKRAEPEVFHSHPQGLTRHGCRGWVTPMSPDPSVDPSFKDHQTRARENAEGKRQKTGSG